MENLNNVPSTGTFGGSVSTINSNFDLVVNAINSLEYQTTRSKGILNYGQNPATVFPNAVAGDWCMILSEGNVFPATIKTYNGSTWSGSGTWNPDGVDLTGYAKTTDMNTAIANSLAQATARMGYGECTVSGTSLAVSIPNFILPTNGGTIHIKMSAAGTGASTLNINNTGAKTLWYNGAAVSAQNTWEAQEIISVFYDGTKYMSSNSQGGGGDAEKIKYDNSQSGLAAQNVQEAIDKEADSIADLFSYEDVGISSISDSFGFIKGTTPPTWATNNSTKNSKVVPVNGAKMVKVTANSSYSATFYFLTSSYTEPTASDNNQVVSSLSAIDGSRHYLPAGESGTFIIPDDCAYIIFNVRSDNVSTYTPYKVELGYVLSDLMTEEIGSSVTKIMSQNAVTKNIMVEEEINLSSLPIINCYMYTNGGNPTWQNGAATNDGVFIPVEPNCLYEVTGCLTGYGSPRFAFLKDNTHVTGRITNFATGWTNYQGVGAGVSKRYIAPSDAHYLFCNESSGSTQMLFSSVKKLTLAKDVAGENKQSIDFITELPDYIIKNPVPVIFGEQNKGSLGANKSWTSTGGHRVVSVSEGDIFTIKGNRFYGWLTDAYTPPTGATTTPYVSGRDRARVFGNTVIDTAPTGAAYLVISTVDGSGNPSSPWEVYKIDSYEEKIQKYAKVRFGSWNVGQYRYVDCAYPNPVLDYLPVGQTVTHAVSAADADAVSLRFRKICNQANVDILGMCEYRPLYSESNLVAKDVLWQCYGNIYEGSTTGANNNTIVFNGLDYIANEEIRYSSQISGGTRYYKHVTAKMAGIEIHIVETHFEHSYPTERTAQMQQLITAMSSYEHVIIGGDFNTNLANTTEEEILQELAMFTDAGYKLANGGYLGRFMTHDEGHKIDNIAAKGFAMNNIQVIQEAGTLSDHWLIYCDLTLL